MNRCSKSGVPDQVFAALCVAVEWLLRFKVLTVLLVSVAFVTSCGDDSAGVAPVVDQLPLTADEATVVPTAARGVSPVAAGETLVFPRHDESIPANRGNQYVYGELSLSDHCLRISYIDQADREGTRDGLLVVWPMGFDARVRGGMVEVTGASGDVVAVVGQTLRLSGKRARNQLAASENWDWGDVDGGQCGGPFWLVGDEATAMVKHGPGVESDDVAFFPRLNHQRGPIVSPTAGMSGRLIMRGRCLLVETSHYPPGEYLVVWPPGFGVQRSGDDLLVVNGGGNVIAQVGDDVTLGGKSVEETSGYSDECPGAYFMAYSVQRSPAG